MQPSYLQLHVIMCCLQLLTNFTKFEKDLQLYSD